MLFFNENGFGLVKLIDIEKVLFGITKPSIALKLTIGASPFVFLSLQYTITFPVFFISSFNVFSVDMRIFSKSIVSVFNSIVGLQHSPEILIKIGSGFSLI